MIKGSIQEEDIIIINIYAPNIGAPQYVRQMLTSMKGEEKAMATHSSVLAWRIPGMGEPGGLHGVAWSRTRLKRLSSSSSSILCFPHPHFSEAGVTPILWVALSGGAWLPPPLPSAGCYEVLPPLSCILRPEFLTI